MEAKDWGGLWNVGSRALGSAEAITVSDGLGHHQPAERQLVTSTWTWRFFSSAFY